MPDEPHHPDRPVSRGLAEPEQERVEKRAREICDKAGRTEILAADLDQAREEILGKGDARPGDHAGPSTIAGSDS